MKPSKRRILLGALVGAGLALGLGGLAVARLLRSGWVERVASESLRELAGIEASFGRVGFAGIGTFRLDVVALRLPRGPVRELRLTRLELDYSLLTLVRSLWDAKAMRVEALRLVDPVLVVAIEAPGGTAPGPAAGTPAGPDPSGDVPDPSPGLERPATGAAPPADAREREALRERALVFLERGVLPRLEISGGRLEASVRGLPRPLEVVAGDLELTVACPGAGRPIRWDLRMRVQDSPVTLRGSLWARGLSGEASLRIHDLDLALLRPLILARVPGLYLEQGRLSLQADVTGKNGVLGGRGRVDLGPVVLAIRDPVRRRIRLRGRILAAPESVSVEDLEIALDDRSPLRVAATAGLAGRPELKIEAELPSFPLAEVLSWLPPGSVPPGLTVLPVGTVSAAASLSGSADPATLARLLAPVPAAPRRPMESPPAVALPPSGTASSTGQEPDSPETRLKELLGLVDGTLSLELAGAGVSIDRPGGPETVLIERLVLDGSPRSIYLRTFEARAPGIAVTAAAGCVGAGDPEAWIRPVTLDLEVAPLVAFLGAPPGRVEALRPTGRARFALELAVKPAAWLDAHPHRSFEDLRSVAADLAGLARPLVEGAREELETLRRVALPADPLGEGLDPFLARFVLALDPLRARLHRIRAAAGRLATDLGLAGRLELREVDLSALRPGFAGLEPGPVQLRTRGAVDEHGLDVPGLVVSTAGLSVGVSGRLEPAAGGPAGSVRLRVPARGELPVAYLLSLLPAGSPLRRLPVLLGGRLQAGLGLTLPKGGSPTGRGSSMGQRGATGAGAGGGRARAGSGTGGGPPHSVSQRSSVVGDPAPQSFSSSTEWGGGKTPPNPPGAPDALLAADLILRDLQATFWTDHEDLALRIRELGLRLRDTRISLGPATLETPLGNLVPVATADLGPGTLDARIRTSGEGLDLSRLPAILPWDTHPVLFALVPAGRLSLDLTAAGPFRHPRMAGTLALSSHGLGVDLRVRSADLADPAALKADLDLVVQDIAWTAGKLVPGAPDVVGRVPPGESVRLGLSVEGRASGLAVEHRFAGFGITGTGQGTLEGRPFPSIVEYRTRIESEGFDRFVPLLDEVQARMFRLLAPRARLTLEAGVEVRGPRLLPAAILRIEDASIGLDHASLLARLIPLPPDVVRTLDTLDGPLALRLTRLVTHVTGSTMLQPPFPFQLEGEVESLDGGLEIGSLDLGFGCGPGRLRVTPGGVQTEGFPIRLLDQLIELSGGIAVNPDRSRSVDLTVRVPGLDLAALSSRLLPPGLEDLELAGRVGLTVHVAGPVDRAELLEAKGTVTIPEVTVVHPFLKGLPFAIRGGRLEILRDDVVIPDADTFRITLGARTFPIPIRGSLKTLARVDNLFTADPRLIGPRIVEAIGGERRLMDLLGEEQLLRLTSDKLYKMKIAVKIEDREDEFELKTAILPEETKHFRQRAREIVDKYVKIAKQKAAETLGFRMQVYGPENYRMVRIEKVSLIVLDEGLNMVYPREIPFWRLTLTPAEF